MELCESRKMARVRASVFSCENKNGMSHTATMTATSTGVITCAVAETEETRQMTFTSNLQFHLNRK